MNWLRVARDWYISAIVVLLALIARSRAQKSPSVQTTTPLAAARFLWKDPEYWPTLAPTLANVLGK